MKRSRADGIAIGKAPYNRAFIAGLRLLVAGRELPPRFEKFMLRGRTAIYE